jgi:tetratricopeptide (TPR) repeat protein
MGEKDVTGSEANRPLGQASDIFVMAKNKFPRRQLAILAVLGVILAAGGGWLVWQHMQTTKPVAPTAKQKQSYEDLTKQTQALDDKNQYGEEAQKIQKYIASGDATPEQKKVQTTQLAATYMRMKDYKSALDTFKQLEADKDSQVVAYTGEAAAYEGLGDKQQAIAMHQKAIDAYKALTGKQQSSTISIEEDAIKRLEASK